MSRFTTGQLLGFGALLLLLAVHPTKAQQQAGWTWNDRFGKTHTRPDLDAVLREHKAWVDSRGNSGEQAILHGANLSHADLSDADLSDADFSGADLTDADLSVTNLQDAIFEPKKFNAGTREIATARDLELLTYTENPDALVQLRRQFADGGFRDQERKITYALKRKEAEDSWLYCKFRGGKTRAILWSSDSNLANCGSF